MKKLSIIIPFYNEAATLETLLNRVRAVDLGGIEKEIIAVDDGSTDDSLAIVNRIATATGEIRVLAFAKNRGKGSAVRAGLEAATGDILIIQDADLEYDPEDYRTILREYRDPSVAVVFGSRILGELRHVNNGASRRHSYHRYYWGGRFVTLVANLVYGAHLTDEPTCYKSLRRELLKEIQLDSTGFEFCPEITAKILQRGHRIVEVPIRYYPRGFEEGKKIRYTDGVKAIWTLIKLRLR